MGIIIKQSLQNAAVSYFGIILGFITSILLFPNILETSQFGLTRSLLAIAIICSQVVSLGLPNSIIKFASSLRQKATDVRGIFWAITLPAFGSLLLISLILIWFKEDILSLYSDSVLLRKYFFLIVPLISSIALFSLLNSYIKSNLNTVFASFLQEIAIRVLIIINLLLVYFGLISFDLFMILFVASYAFPYLILLVYAFSKRLVTTKIDISPFDKDTRQVISKYSFYSFFGGFTMVLVGNVDLLMVDIFKGLEQTGIYAVALYVGVVISVPKKSIGKISFPIISSAFHRNDMNEVSTVYRQSSINMILFGLLIYIGVVANIHNLFKLLPDEYATGSIVIIIIGLANLFDMITGCNGQIILSSKYYKFDLLFSIVLMVTAILLNYQLIPKYGLIGAATATASSIFIYNLIKLVFVWIKFRILPFTWKTLWIPILGAFSLGINYLIPVLDFLILDLIIRSILITAIFFFAIWFFDISREAKETLISFVTKFKN
ncbi:MAG: oligosaccharide flippase family protein [Balneolaceae bacterium]|nr:oligosaccharide flippase family protein [Balneolaceae bacterium]MBO6546044.1 oligosaccharide flippase family protein [Balneolaceae bacterium]MBO6647440.1 oligosaccharide flippase family protein [Balneolaceae bacterium]